MTPAIDVTLEFLAVPINRLLERVTLRLDIIEVQALAYLYFLLRNPCSSVSLAVKGLSKVRKSPLAHSRHIRGVALGVSSFRDSSHSSLCEKSLLLL
jgi:hypothetical protein